MIIRGGHPKANQLMEYDILNDNFTDYGMSYLHENMSNYDGEYGTGIYFTQINSTTLYTIRGVSGTKINVYDLPSLSYRDLGTTIPKHAGDSACISSSTTPSHQLYITGGEAFGASLQILSINSMEWTSNPNPPSMNNNRSAHGCIISNDKLWAFGGYETNSVEAVNTTDITNENWQIIGNLSCNRTEFGVTEVDGVIYIVGGQCSDGAVSDNVQTIDTTTNAINVYEHSLPHAVYGMPVMVIDYTIYGFGGYTESSPVDSLLTLDLLRPISITFLPLTLYYRFTFVIPNRPTPVPTTSPTEELSLCPSLSLLNIILIYFSI